jgi:hypothetical protein
MLISMQHVRATSSLKKLEAAKKKYNTRKESTTTLV